MNTASITQLGAGAKPIALHIARFCEREGIAVEFRKTGRHPHAEITVNRQTRKVFFSGTPSDHRTMENVIRDLKQQARSIGWEPRKEPEMPPVKTLADLPKLVEPAASRPPAPAIPDAWRGKSVRGNIRDPELRVAFDRRNVWVRDAMRDGLGYDEVMAALRKAGWDVQSISAIDMMVNKADGGSYKASKPAAPKMPRHEPEVQHRAPAASIDPLVLAIAEAIAPLMREQLAKHRKELEAMKAKADKWDAISGLVREA